MNFLRADGRIVAPAFVLAYAANASAQVVNVGFGAPQSVPLSPWLTAAMTAMLAIAAVAFLRKRIGSGAFMLMLGVVAGGMTLQSQDSVAGGTQLPLQLQLVTSPATSDYTAIQNNSSCNTKLITVTSASPVRIESISVTPALNWSIDQPGSTCSVGTVVGSCTLRIEELFTKGSIRPKC